MQIVVVGGSGVIGRRAIPLLAQAGHQVTALVRSDEAAAKLPDAKTVVGDVWDRAFMRPAFDGADAVIMLATAVPPPSKAAKPKSWEMNNRIRAVLAPQVSQLAKDAGATRLVQESLIFLYKDGGEFPISEESAIDPTSTAVACLTAEHGARRFTTDREGDASAVVLRFANFVSGDTEMTTSVLDQAKKGFALVLGDLDGYLTFIDVDDAAKAVVAAVDLPSGTYNVGADPVSKREYLKVLASVSHRKSVRALPGPARTLVPVVMPISKTLARSFRMDSSKLRREGWKPLRSDAHTIWARAAAIADDSRAAPTVAR